MLKRITRLSASIWNRRTKLASALETINTLDYKNKLLNKFKQIVILCGEWNDLDFAKFREDLITIFMKSQARKKPSGLTTAYKPKFVLTVRKGASGQIREIQGLMFLLVISTAHLQKRSIIGFLHTAKFSNCLNAT